MLKTGRLRGSVDLFGEILNLFSPLAPRWLTVLCSLGVEQRISL